MTYGNDAKRFLIETWVGYDLCWKDLPATRKLTETSMTTLGGLSLIHRMIRFGRFA